MLPSIDEINQNLKKHIAKALIAPILFLLSLLVPMVSKFLTDYILPILSLKTLWILTLLFAYLSILLFSYIYALRKKIKDTPTLETLRFKEWEETKKQYKEHEIVQGFSLYTNIESLEKGKNPQYACPVCFANKKISHVNCESNIPELGVFICPVCDKHVGWNRYDYSNSKK
jgi:hypothetical protein